MQRQTTSMIILWTAYMLILVVLKFYSKTDFFYTSIVLVAIIIINEYVHETFIQKYKDLTEEAINIAVLIAKKKEKARIKGEK